MNCNAISHRVDPSSGPKRNFLRRAESKAVLCRALLALAVSSLGGVAQAQSTYPTKAIKLMVPMAPAGPADIMARVVAKRLSEGIGQQLIVESQGGGGGTIATEAVMRAAPDGYTLVIGSLSTLVTGPILNPAIRYDPIKSFAPVSMMAIAPSMVLVNPGVPAKSLRELIDLAKAKPGALNFGSNGTGTLTHLAGELFKSMTGVDIVHVPYKGAAPATSDLMAGQIQMIFVVPSGLEQHVRAGKLRALAVASSKRHSVFPEVPTSAEAGLPGFETYTWFGLSAPLNTPAPVIARLNAEMVKTLAAKEVTEVLSKQGLEAGASTPEQFGQFIASEIAKWSRIVKSAGIKLEN